MSLSGLTGQSSNPCRPVVTGSPGQSPDRVGEGDDRQSVRRSPRTVKSAPMRVAPTLIGRPSDLPGRSRVFQALIQHPADDTLILDQRNPSAWPEFARVGMANARILNRVPEVVEQLHFRAAWNADRALQPIVPPVEFHSAGQLGFHAGLDDPHAETELCLRFRRRPAAFDPPQLKLVAMRFPGDLNAAGRY